MAKDNNFTAAFTESRLKVFMAFTREAGEAFRQSMIFLRQKVRNQPELILVKAPSLFQKTISYLCSFELSGNALNWPKISRVAFTRIDSSRCIICTQRSSTASESVRTACITK